MTGRTPAYWPDERDPAGRGFRAAGGGLHLAHQHLGPVVPEVSGMHMYSKIFYSSRDRPLGFAVLRLRSKDFFQVKMTVKII